MPKINNIPKNHREKDTPCSIYPAQLESERKWAFGTYH